MKTKRAILWIAVSSGQQATEEKDSLPEQERRLREIAEQRGWQIIDIITIPGHSRVYYNYPEFAAAAATEGIPGALRMLEHWARRDFDVFACIAGDRFGRAASIFNEVVERTYDAGAQVFTLRDGLIERGNEGTWAVMASYAASSEVKELRRRHKFGMNKRAEMGLPISSRVKISHCVVRDERGRSQKLVVNEELRPLFADLATVFLEGVAWHSLERVLYERYGYVGKNGKPYPPRYFHPLLISPVFWGHNARNFWNERSPNVHRRGEWMFDETVPAPDGVMIYYNTHEPVYTGELAERMKAELRRRMSLRGSARPNSPYPLTGMFECYECGWKMAFVNSHGKWRAARCNVAYNMKPPHSCTQRKAMPERYAIDYMKRLVALVVESDDGVAFIDSLMEAPNAPDPTPDLERQIEELEEEKRVLLQLRLRLKNPNDKIYDEQEDILNERLEIAQQRLDMHRLQNASPIEIADQVTAIDYLRQMGDTFWQLQPHEINHWLRRALGRRVFRVRDGKITKLRRYK